MGTDDTMFERKGNIVLLTKIISKMQLFENKRVTLLNKLNW